MNQPIIVVVIAHNDEQNIKNCLESLKYQTVKPSKIIVVLHNTQDRTHGVVVNFRELNPEGIIQIIPYPCAPQDIVHARLKALEHIGDEGQILCIDGDSIAERTWVEKMSDALSRPGNIFVGSAVKVKGPLICRLLNVINKRSSSLYKEKAKEGIWPSSYAFYARDKYRVSDSLEKSIYLKQKLSLPMIPEINILAKFMNLLGKNEELINSTYVTKYVDEKSSREILEHMKNYRKSKFLVDQYFKTECGSS